MARPDDIDWGAVDVTVRFGGIAALTNVTIDLPPGQVTAVVGGDGAGKTTLLGALAGRVPVGTGTVTMPDRRRVGVQPSTSGVWGDLSVDENVDFVAEAYSIPRDSLAERRARLLSRAGLDHVGGRLGAQLSGGMRQKLGFCLAMLPDPEVLLLDEPSTGVDPVSRVQLWQLIAEAAAGGAAVLLLTTYLDEAQRAHRVLVLDEGHTLGFGSPDDIVSSLPGAITSSGTRPDGVDAHRCWRRGTDFRIWRPNEVASSSPGDVDLEDAVIALMLAREEARRD
ncbi:ABC transporter ATP-binding protein [Rhodococcus sp. D2-41]|nr:ABC transporter ATP-binding protein [Rhodococcus sp. D2-41]